MEVMREGMLEKRSSGLLQLWKKKRCVLTEEGLRLRDCRDPGGEDGDAPCVAFGAKAKELRFDRMTTVDCVEYKRGLVYFTVVMATGCADREEPAHLCTSPEDLGRTGALKAKNSQRKPVDKAPRSLH
uniref:PH domain-containing protein n=1 Tax=Knipowitschia caucasica TaxID=637954 RepID=A0AAV2LYX7_KNICA